MESRKIDDAAREITARLATAGASAPHVDALWLLAHVLEADREALALRGEEFLTEEAAERIVPLIAARERGVPLAHLLGEWEFWSLTLQVTPEVLIPRPETELLVEWGLELLGNVAEPRIAEIGTGSGCIAIALAHELPAAVVAAVDISPAALHVARRNVERHDLESRISLHEGDLLGPLSGEPAFDLIVSNPPYVAPGDPQLDPAVATHEPAIALFDAPDGDGLGVYRRLAEEAPARLAPGGHILVELSENGAPAVRALFESVGCRVDTRRDLAGIERALSAHID